VASSYPRKYVDACRDRVRQEVATYRRAATAARQPGERKPPADSPFGRLEPVFFGNMLLALESCFPEPPGEVTAADGAALAEVRLLCSALRENGGGGQVGLTEEQFVRLADAFLDEIEARHSS
jgi:hypothetical protein